MEYVPIFVYSIKDLASTVNLTPVSISLKFEFINRLFSIKKLFASA